MLANVLFRLPDDDKIYFIKGQITNALHDINFDTTDTCFVVSPYAQQNKAYIVKPDEMGVWDETPFDMEYINASQQSTSEAYYKQYVQQTIDTLKEDAGIKKIVCARVKNIQKPIAFNGFDLYKKLTTNYPNAFTYLISSAVTGTWIGASPELLLHHQSNKITSVALAGTLPNDDKISWSDKEILEQKWVEDFIYDTLNPYAENVNKSEVETIVTGNIKHLKTTFSASIKNENNSINKVLEKLNPTPAVCGLPKHSAMQYIKQHEGFDRQFYSGFIGLTNFKNQSQLYVNIRCAQIFENNINQYVGAGIIFSSLPDKEWIETENKLMALGRFL